MPKTATSTAADGPPILPLPVPGILAWAEAAGLTAVFPALGYWLNPADPFFLEAQFPWPILAPLLLGLRYGLAEALGSTLALVAAMAGGWYYGLAGVKAFPSDMLIGLLTMSLLAGEFRSVWDGRLNRLAALGRYQQQRLNGLSRAYQRLKTSAALLEDGAQNGYPSLRLALTRIEDSLGGLAEDAFRDLAAQVLGLFGRFGHLQSAALFWVEPDGSLAPASQARIGNPPESHAPREILLEALQTGQTVTLDPAERGHDDVWLGAVPLVDASGTAWGLVAIHEMPFGLFNQRHLTLLTALGGHAADAVSLWRDRCPDTTGKTFRMRLIRCVEDARRWGMPSTLLVCVVAPETGREEVLAFLRRSCRRVDQTSVVRSGGRLLLLRLLPLTGPLGAQGYLQRLATGFENHCGEDWAERVDIRRMDITADTRLDELLREMADGLHTFSIA